MLQNAISSAGKNSFWHLFRLDYFNDLIKNFKFGLNLDNFE